LSEAGFGLEQRLARHLMRLGFAAAALVAAAGAFGLALADTAPEGAIAVLAVLVSLCLASGVGAWYLRARLRLAAEEAEAVARRENATARKLEDYRRLVRHAGDAVLVIDPEAGAIIDANWRASEVYDVPLEALIGRPLASVSRSAEDLRVRLSDLVESGAPQQFDALHQQADGTPLHFHVSATPVEFHGRRAVLCVQREVTEQKRLEEHLRHLVFHDPLTGLANRVLFKERVEHAFARLGRDATSLIVMFIDLDDFKEVNDTFGHHVGDQLLRGAAKRLTDALRSVDTVARLSGDEFAVLLEDAEHEDYCIPVVERILHELCRPFPLDGRDAFVGASIGIASSQDASSAEELLRHADMAMYAAKGRGKGRYAVFQPQMGVLAAERMDLEAELREALDRSEFELYYQPIVSLESGRVAGLEALLRWNHPKRQVVEPAVFLPVAEETGLIVPLGTWVLGEACRKIADWRSAFPHHAALTGTVNIANRQLHNTDLASTVAAALAETGLQPGALVLEATESALMRDLDMVRRVFSDLDALGVQLAIDDFGTGYSSIAHIARLPIDQFKIDRSFTSSIGRSHGDATLARAIVMLGRTLGVETVAEGIRTHQQLSLLQAMGCRFGQGFLFSPPVPAAEIDVLLARKGPLWIPADGPADCDPASPQLVHAHH
jgi:diguanylate cyclase (GGDEF)-like protein/PAS domain S-box-containing protein